MVYADGKGSLFTIHSVPTMPGPTTVYTFELVPEEVVDLYTHFIENKRYGMRMEDAHCARGEAHLFLGADGLALRDFEERAATEREACGGVSRGRGNAYGQQGKSDRAMADLDEAVRLDQGLTAALIDRGNAHRENGALEDAIRDFDRAIAIMKTGAYHGRTGVADGHFYRGVARFIQEDWPEAKADLESARKEGVLVASSFRNICRSVAGFEAEHELRMPSDVATMLYVG